MRYSKRLFLSSYFVPEDIGESDGPALATLISVSPIRQSFMTAALTTRLVSAVLLVAIAISSGTSAFFYQQQSAQTSKSSDLSTQLSAETSKSADLTNQISTLNSQITILNNQISQLLTLNSKLSGNNTELQSQVSQLNNQVAQLQSQVNTLQNQLAARENLQSSRIVAQQVTLYRSSFGNGYPITYFVALGQLPYSGYLRIVWSATPRISFTAIVFEINITTPVQTSGAFSVPVSGNNATSLAWFTCYDYYTVNGANVCSGPDSGVMTYSITYWY